MGDLEYTDLADNYVLKNFVPNLVINNCLFFIYLVYKHLFKKNIQEQSYLKSLLTYIFLIHWYFLNLKKSNLGIQTVYYLKRVLLKLQAKRPASYGLPFITVCSKSTSSKIMHISLSRFPRRLLSLIFADPMITVLSSAINSLLWTYTNSET